MEAANVETPPDFTTELIRELTAGVTVVLVVTAAGIPGATGVVVRQYSGIVVTVTVTEFRQVSQRPCTNCRLQVVV